MKLKNLLAAIAIMLASAVGALSIGDRAFAAFNADDHTNGCRPGTLYYEYNYKRVKNADGTYSDVAKDASEQTGPAPKDAADIKTANDCNLAKTDYDMMERLNVVINVIVGVLGVVTVFMIVLGGIMYATSQGDAAKATKAKNTIIFGVVGLIIALLAFAIVNFVLKNVFA